MMWHADDVTSGLVRIPVRGLHKENVVMESWS